jgi:hypothetical protein
MTQAHRARREAESRSYCVNYMGGQILRDPRGMDTKVLEDDIGPPL